MIRRVPELPGEDAESAARVYPTTPTPGDEPFSGARPYGSAAATTSPQRTPAWTRAVRATGSIVTPSIRRVVIRTPPSHGPGTPCPVVCTSTGSPAPAAYVTAATTSPAEAAPTTTSGRRANPVWNPAASSSYPGSPGTRTSRSAALRSCTFTVSSVSLHRTYGGDSLRIT